MNPLAAAEAALKKATTDAQREAANKALAQMAGGQRSGPQGARGTHCRASLRSSQEGGQSVLDRAMVLYGSNMGNASSHDSRNLPTLLAGGGFRQGQHLAFDPGTTTCWPLSTSACSSASASGLTASAAAPRR
jgi:hypothetical protein